MVDARHSAVPTPCENCGVPLHHSDTMAKKGVANKKGTAKNVKKTVEPDTDPGQAPEACVADYAPRRWGPAVVGHAPLNFPSGNGENCLFEEYPRIMQSTLDILNDGGDHG